MEVNWEQVREEAAAILQQLIRIDTTNPPGNELAAALYLEKLLQKEGIAVELHQATEQRANLVARPPGTGQQRPLVLLSHLDVVAANPAQWQYPPFAGVIAQGHIWGRGTLDMKGMLVMELLVLLLLKRSGIIPSRELILVAAADEEAGGGCGMEWLMGQGLPGLTAAEYVINEGGEGRRRGGIPVYSCQNGEKGICWIKLTVPGTTGHAAHPVPDNALFNLARVLERLRRWRPPLALCQTTRAFLTELARLDGLTMPIGKQPSENDLQTFVHKQLRRERAARPMFYNTITPTMLQAGVKANVLPESCELTIDCRLVPGTTPDEFIKELCRVVADPRINLEVLHHSPATESNPQTKLFQAIQQAVVAEEPHAAVIPYLSPGGTDSRHFRKLGITAYGFMPVIISDNDQRRVHGIDERLSLLNLERGCRMLFRVVKKMVSNG